MKAKMKISFLSVFLLFIVMNSNAQLTDVVMWYDCDNGALINSRPDGGWWNLNPEYPADPTSGGPWRTTTSLLGKYESQDTTIIKQHAYWIKASGCNVISCDLTNSCSPSQSGLGADMLRYVTGVNLAFQLQLKYLSKITEFDAPTAYPTIRLTSTNYSNLTLMLNDMYALYQAYPTKWYKLDDGTANTSKPFIVIFADGGLLNTWAQSGIPSGAKDSRFNIRYSNGYLLAQANITQTDGNSYKYISGSLPFWFFVENTATSTGYYKTVYKNKPSGSGVEQMITWASVHLGSSSWDGLRDLVNGVTPIVRYSQNISSLSPQVLLANRFNYAIGWYNEPQEGLSRNKSTHIEPNVDWGFTEFNEFASQMYILRNYSKNAPPSPVPYYFNDVTNKLKIKLDGYPTEYRISNNSSFSGASWTFLNVGTNGISLSGINQSQAIYVQTRNGFGTSQVGNILRSGSMLTTTIDDQDVSSITYSGTWQTGAWSGYYDTSCRYSNSTGASAKFMFTGTGIQWIADKNADHGKANVYIDGVLKTTVDLYNATDQLQQIVYSISSLTNSQHTIRIDVTGTKNPNATGYYVNIDAFKITDTNTSTIAIDDMYTSSITYSGSNWQTGLWSYYFNNSCHYSNTSGSTASFTFTGTGIQWIADKNADHGKADVYIDGVFKTTVDLYNVSDQLQQVVYSTSSLSYGQHTIQINVTGTKNSSAIGTYVNIDAFQIVGGLKSAFISNDPVKDINETSDLRVISFAVYPNPATGQITINSGQNLVERINLINLEGKVVYSKAVKFIGTKTIDLPLAKGTYFLKLTGDAPFATQKLIIE